MPGFLYQVSRTPDPTTAPPKKKPELQRGLLTGMLCSRLSCISIERVSPSTAMIGTYPGIEGGIPRVRNRFLQATLIPPLWHPSRFPLFFLGVGIKAAHYPSELEAGSGDGLSMTTKTADKVVSKTPLVHPSISAGGNLHLLAGVHTALAALGYSARRRHMPCVPSSRNSPGVDSVVCATCF